MIVLTFKVKYSHPQRAEAALATYRRDVRSIKRMIDNALNLRAKLIFDSSPFQSVALETTIERIYREKEVVFIVVRTNQTRLVSGYEAALNGTTFFVFDGVAKILLNQFQRDEFLNGDYIQGLFIDVSGAKETKTPLGQVLDPVSEPIVSAWNAVKVPLTIIVVAVALAIISYFVFKIFELYKK